MKGQMYATYEDGLQRLKRLKSARPTKKVIQGPSKIGAAYAVTDFSLLPQSIHSISLKQRTQVYKKQIMDFILKKSAKHPLLKKSD